MADPGPEDWLQDMPIAHLQWLKWPNVPNLRLVVTGSKGSEGINHALARPQASQVELPAWSEVEIGAAQGKVSTALASQVRKADKRGTAPELGW